MFAGGPAAPAKGTGDCSLRGSRVRRVMKGGMETGGGAEVEVAVEAAAVAAVNRVGGGGGRSSDEDGLKSGLEDTVQQLITA